MSDETDLALPNFNVASTRDPMTTCDSAVDVKTKQQPWHHPTSAANKKSITGLLISALLRHLCQLPFVNCCDMDMLVNSFGL
eukprot:scaffold81774_cov32-Cyclotella_meneghiniana.AAC.1